MLDNIAALTEIWLTSAWPDLGAFARLQKTNRTRARDPGLASRQDHRCYAPSRAHFRVVAPLLEERLVEVCARLEIPRRNVTVRLQQCRCTRTA